MSPKNMLNKLSLQTPSETDCLTSAKNLIKILDIRHNFRRYASGFQYHDFCLIKQFLHYVIQDGNAYTKTFPKEIQY